MVSLSGNEARLPRAPHANDDHLRCKFTERVFASHARCKTCSLLSLLLSPLVLQTNVIKKLIIVHIVVRFT